MAERAQAAAQAVGLCKSLLLKARADGECACLGRVVTAKTQLSNDDEHDDETTTREHPRSVIPYHTLTKSLQTAEACRLLESARYTSAPSLCVRAPGDFAVGAASQPRRRPK